MILKNTMEEKQLNFSQPLLSVRRGSSIAPPENERKTSKSQPSLPPLPYYKSELKSGPIRNPGVVPFKWEQMPGRPKGENEVRNDTLKCLPPVPKLPPGRIANHVQKQTDEVLQDSPTSSSRCQAEMDGFHTLETSSLDKILSDVEGSGKGKEDNDASSSEDEILTYADARETLSRTESFNCSVSGVSGLDGPESSGTFSDPQARDFMMGRFLPAAKAVASEIPSFASRRQPVAREQAKPVMKMVKLKKQSLQYESISDPFPLNIKGEGKDEEENEEDESDGAEDLPIKLCGLIPRFCMLNPIPGMRDHVQGISSVRSVRTRPAYAAGGRDIKHKDGTKNNRGEVERTVYRYARKNESLMNSHLGHNGMLREKNASPQLLLNREKQLLGFPGEPRDFSSFMPNVLKNDHTKLDSAAYEDTEDITTLTNRPAYEKTLYVDFESMVESRHSNSSSLESRGRNPSVDSLQDAKSLSLAEENAIPQSKTPGIANFSALSTSDMSCLGVSEHIKYLQKVDQGANLIINAEQLTKSDIKSIKHSKNCSSPLGLTPLLPKSPSESWLSRTLPSMPSKSYLANHAFRHSPIDPKRERLLKASNVQNMLFLSAGELAPISEN